MSSRDDLYGAFALLEDRAPTSCEVPMRAPSLARRVALPAAAAATVTAVAVGVPLALSHQTAHRGSSPAASTHASLPTTPPSHRPAPRPAGFASGIPAPAPGAPTDLQLSFTVDHVSGYTVVGDEANRTYEHAAISATNGRRTADGNTVHGELYLFYRGGYVPSDALHGQQVTVHGRPAYLGTALPPYTDGTHQSTVDGAVPLDSIAWQYAPDSWALVAMQMPLGSHVRPDADLIRLATAVRPGEQALPMLFRLTYLPPGLVADGAWAQRGSLYGSHVGVADSQPGVPGNVSVIAPPGYGGPALDVNVFKVDAMPGKPFPDCSLADEGDSPQDDQATPFAVPGGAGCAYYKDGKVSWIAIRHGGNGGYGITVNLDAKHYGRYSLDQLRKIADGAVFAPKIDDPGTWFDATTVLPHH